MPDGDSLRLQERSRDQLKPIVKGPDGDLSAESIIAACLAAAPRSKIARDPRIRKYLIVAYLLFGLVCLMPMWALNYLPRSRRPRRNWSLERCLRIKWGRYVSSIVARSEIDSLGRDLSQDPDSTTLTHSHPITIPAAPANYLVGHPADALRHLEASRGKWDLHLVHRDDRHLAGVWGAWNSLETPATHGFAPVKAFWYCGSKNSPSEAPPARRLGEKCMLLFHGGGYVCGTAAETDLTSSIAKETVARSGVSHVLSVDYRLASSAPWPLPLLDAISAYRWLVKVEGVSEENIVVAGDSAGGHLALALTRWLRDEQKATDLRTPRGLMLFSPWVDLGFSDAAKHGDPESFVGTDIVDWSFGPFASSLLLRAQPSSIMFDSPYVSPASLLLPPVARGERSFEDFPPTMIIHGEVECLAQSINTLWTRLQIARRSQPGNVGLDQIYAAPDASHDFMIFPWMRPEADQAYLKMTEWLEQLFGPPPPMKAGNPVTIRPRMRQRRSRPLLRWQRASAVLAPPVASFRTAQAQLQY